MTIYDDRPWLKAYDPGVSPDIQIPDNTTYSDALMEGLTAFPDRTAMVFMGTAISFRQLDLLSRRFAAFLAGSRIPPGSVVGLSLPNIPQFLIALCGAMRAGCTVTGVSPLLVPRELAHQLNDSGCRVLVTLDAVFERVLTKISDPLPDLSHIVTANIGDYLPPVKRFLGKILKKIPSGRVTPWPGKTIQSFKQLMAEYPPEATANMTSQISISPNDVCLIQYTGGTTGTPKGVELTHRNIIANLTQMRH